MLTNIAIWVGRILLSLLLALTLVPLLPTGAWFVRVTDFPRQQVLALVAPFCLVVAISLWLSFSTERAVWLGMLVGIGLLQMTYILPYTPLHHKEVPDAKQAKASVSLRVMVANLKYDNKQKSSAIDTVMQQDPDLLLLVEVNNNWKAALQPLEKKLPYRWEKMMEKGLGMALFSKYPLLQTEVRFLVSERRPSLFAVLEIPNQCTLRVSGVHPVPPGLSDETGNDRRDSRARDAELVLLARHIQKNEDQAWIVMGDFNDVAWSATTHLFKNLSGLRDPRVGRRLLNTFHADNALIRYPIDHIFLSQGFALRNMGRIRIPGSDHFGVWAELQADLERAGSLADATPSQKNKAKQLVEEGKEDVKERNISSKSLEQE
ncbi:MAG: endonuclease/exonuclease/phosphatase family protein [Deltaproteobacteria bacterium]|nr:MAG: endonuclease/exonuclease/phosphatase family protein [Deltaproteobacteria bacterium]